MSTTGAPEPPPRGRDADRERIEALTRMASGVAHDYNNFLAAIQGNAAVVGRQLASPVARASLDQIESAARRALDLTARILAYTGRTPLLLEDTDLSALAADMVPELDRLLAREPGLRLVCELPAGLPAVPCDPAQVREVIRNLVRNAADSMAEMPGTVRLATSVATCTADELAAMHAPDDPLPGRYACIDVRDEGRGMTEHVRRRMFDPFFTTRMRADGMGLCVVHGVTRAHAGAIDVQTGVDRGTRVRVFLPCRKAAH